MKGYKVFGSSLDVLDDPYKIILKHSYINALLNNILPKPDFKNPYEFIKNRLKNREDINNLFEFIGEVPISSYLTSKPEPNDILDINQDSFNNFIQSNGCYDCAKSVEKFVKDSILPQIPVMIGVDHSASGGIIKGVSDFYNREDISILIMDSHFDGIPTDLRKRAYYVDRKTSSFIDNYSCGNFIEYLIREKIVLPDRVFIMGIKDYPNDIDDNPSILDFKNFYHAFEEKGCSFLQYNDVVSKPEGFDKLLNNISTPYLYLSIDMDVISNPQYLAVRIPEIPGIDVRLFNKIIRKIRNRIDIGQFELVGLDIMEMDIHLLGLELPGGNIDKTDEIALDTMRLLLV